jgi:uncharacterized membrane protein
MRPQKPVTKDARDELIETMSVSKSPERLVFFSDAVVAIALTLLVLPLTGAVPDAVSRHTSAFQLITENQWQIFSFLLSFVVIARLWIVHHRLFEQVVAYNQRLIVLNLCWLLTIAVLPFPTEMAGAFGNDRFTVTFYIGTVLASKIFLFAMTVIIRSAPDVAKNHPCISDRHFFASGVTTVILGWPSR